MLLRLPCEWVDNKSTKPVSDKPQGLHPVREELSLRTGCCLCGKQTLCQSLSVGVACADLGVCVVTATFSWEQTSHFQKSLILSSGSAWSRGCFRPPLHDPCCFAVHLFHVTREHNAQHRTSMVLLRVPFVEKNDH